MVFSDHRFESGSPRLIENLDELFSPEGERGTRYVLNRLTGEALLITPHRSERFMHSNFSGDQGGNGLQGGGEEYDPRCVLCPGNTRAGGITPDYRKEGICIIPNDFPVIANPYGSSDIHILTHRHSAIPSTLTLQELQRIVDTWCTEFCRNKMLQAVSCIHLFMNVGKEGGASQSHLHSQAWYSGIMGPGLEKVLRAQVQFYQRNSNQPLLQKVLEAAKGVGKSSLVVEENGSFTILVPPWAYYRNEVLVIPHRHIPSIDGLNRGEREDLAQILKSLFSRYDKVFGKPLPFTMGQFNAPVVRGQEWPEVRFYLKFSPPMLTPNNEKRTVGGENFIPQSDIEPFVVAQQLRDAGSC